MNLVTRAQWGARPPAGTTPMTGAPGIKVHWEGTTQGTSPHSSCAARVRGIQAFHMDGRGWADIAYNFLACVHGYVFEGRGLANRSAANGNTTLNANDGAICAMVGVGDPQPDPLRTALRDGIDYWIARWHNDRILGHRDGKSTECPGDQLYAWVHSGAPRPTEENMAITEAEFQRINLIVATQNVSVNLRSDEAKATYAAAAAAGVEPLLANLDNIVTTVTDADLARIATAVTDETARRLEG